MKRLFFLVFVLVSIANSGNAQFQKLYNEEYFMCLKPLIGSLRGSSNLTEGINPNLDLQSRGWVWGLDWVNAEWADVDGFLVPKLQVPIKVRSMSAKTNKGLFTSDGTYFPKNPAVDLSDKADAPFSYLDFGLDFYYSPYSYQMGTTIITPKCGLGMDIGRHSYELDLSKYIGKEGTYAGLQNDINASYSPFYSYTFWEDLYGFNLGCYFSVGKRVFIDAGWEYYPVGLVAQAMGNSINSIWNTNSISQKSNSTKLSRFALEGQFRIVSWVSAVVKYEYSNYNFECSSFNIGDLKINQKYSNLMFGVTLEGPQLDD